jgi:hypothetical protein
MIISISKRWLVSLAFQPSDLPVMRSAKFESISDIGCALRQWFRFSV